MPARTFLASSRPGCVRHWQRQRIPRGEPALRRRRGKHAVPWRLASRYKKMLSEVGIDIQAAVGTQVAPQVAAPDKAPQGAAPAAVGATVGHPSPVDESIPAVRQQAAAAAADPRNARRRGWERPCISKRSMQCFFILGSRMRCSSSNNANMVGAILCGCLLKD